MMYKIFSVMCICVIMGSALGVPGEVGMYVCRSCVI